MRVRKNVMARGQSGQSLVETVFAMPLVLLLVFNAINFACFFLVFLNISVAPRAGVEYAMLGGQTPGTNGLATASGPAITTASYLTYQDMTGAIHSPGTIARVQVCSKSLGFANGIANCSTCTSSTGTCTAAAAGNPAPAADSEPAKFVLQRVDVTYTFTPLLPQALFNLTILAIPECTGTSNVTCVFHRQVSMRAMD